MSKKTPTRTLKNPEKPSPKSSPRKTRKKKKFTVSVSGDQVGYFVNVPKTNELRKLRGKGVRTVGGLMALSDVLSGDEEVTWLSPMSVVAMANGKKLPINERKNKDEPLIQDFRRKNVIFVESTTDNAEYRSEVYAYSVDEIRIEVWHSESWILPNRQAIDIYTLEIVSPKNSGLEYYSGGGGCIQGELITADGKSYGLDEQEDEETGESIVTVS